MLELKGGKASFSTTFMLMNIIVNASCTIWVYLRTLCCKFLCKEHKEIICTTCGKLWVRIKLENSPKPSRQSIYLSPYYSISQDSQESVSFFPQECNFCAQKVWADSNLLSIWGQGKCIHGKLEPQQKINRCTAENKQMLVTVSYELNIQSESGSNCWQHNTANSWIQRSFRHFG